MAKKKVTCHDLPPFESLADAQKIADAMHDDVQALREKYGIHHMLVLVAPMIRTEDGENVFAAQIAIRHGSEAELLLQVAALYGRLKNEHAMTMEKLLSRKAKETP